MKIEENDFNEIIELIDEFDNRFLDYVTNNIVLSDDYKNIVVRSISKAIISFRCILILTKNGYPDEALIQFRYFYEIFIILKYISLRKKKDTSEQFELLIRNFFADYENKRLRMEKVWAKEVLSDEKQLREIDTLIANNNQTDRKSSYWWAGEGFNTFTKIENEVIKSFEEETNKKATFLKLIHEFVTNIAHFNSYSMYRHLGFGSEIHYISTCKVLKGQGFVFHYSLLLWGLIVLESEVEMPKEYYDNILLLSDKYINIKE